MLKGQRTKANRREIHRFTRDRKSNLPIGFNQVYAPPPPAKKKVRTRDSNNSDPRLNKMSKQRQETLRWEWWRNLTLAFKKQRATCDGTLLFKGKLYPSHPPQHSLQQIDYFSLIQFLCQFWAKTNNSVIPTGLFFFNYYTQTVIREAAKKHAFPLFRCSLQLPSLKLKICLHTVYWTVWG